MNSTLEKKPEKIDIGVLVSTLKERGISGAELGPSNEFAVWIIIGQQFRVENTANSVILFINDLIFEIERFTAPYSRNKKEIKKALALKKIPNT